MDTYNEQTELLAEGKRLRGEILVAEMQLIENPDHGTQAQLNEKRNRLRVIETALASFGTTLDAELLVE